MDIPPFIRKLLPMSWSRLLVFVIAVSLLALGGCRWGRNKAAPAKDYNRQLNPGAQALREISSDRLPQVTLTTADRASIAAALENSLRFMGRPGSQRFYPIAGISHDEVRRSCDKLLQLLRTTPDDAALFAAIRRDFRVFMSVGCDDEGTVLFTGYYTPIFDGSLTPDARFRYPLYKRPADLVTAPGDQIATQRLPDGSSQPYPTRAVLEASGALNGLELVYLADPFETYIIQVQGSGKIRLPDGNIIDVGYDGTNNHRYHPIAEDMIKEGRIRREDLSLATLRAYFRANPPDVAVYVARNPRYIFFARTQGGPFGSLGQPVTKDVTVATDKSIFPPGGPMIVATQSADANGRPVPYAGIRVDQDTGGAIRAPGRCDLYMGEGLAAENRAGFQFAEGQMYYLIAR